MAYVDALTFFEPLAGTAMTSTAVSTNVLDFGVGSGCTRAVHGRCAGAGRGNPGDVLTSFTSGSTNTTLNVQVQGAPDNGSGSPGGYQTIYETGVQYLGQLVAASSFPGEAARWPGHPEAGDHHGHVDEQRHHDHGGQRDRHPVRLAHRRSGRRRAGYRAGHDRHRHLGHHDHHRQATTAAAATATAVSFVAAEPIPRYFRLNYVVANGPFTGGTLWAGIALDSDAPLLYPPGFAFPAGT